MVKPVKKLVDLDIAGKRVLIRQDLNVPLDNGTITSSKRIDASLPTIKLACDKGAKVLLMSHLGRPEEGRPDPAYSLKPVSEYLTTRLGQPVKLKSDYLKNNVELKNGQAVLLENVRFNSGESTNDPALGKRYAQLCDIFVMDAFGTAHRAQASTYGVGMYAEVACAGPLLTAELEALKQALEYPEKPLIAIVGGAKVSTKLTVLESLSGVVDRLITGGGIANTFIAAAGFSIGKSLYEPELVDRAAKIVAEAVQNGTEIPIPTDVVVGRAFSKDEKAIIKPVDGVGEDDMIFDIGPETTRCYADMIKEAATIVWNGPVGVFEFDQFALGTEKLGEAIAGSPAFSIAGGGDTLAAIEKFNLTDRISYISTGGGAFLEFLEGKTLPAVEMLVARA